MSEANQRLDACHCCEGIRRLTPAEHANRPGLSALAYRVGTHGSFKATMQARIGTMPTLGALGTRRDDDFTVAFIDAWATVADVLSFYTERIANEGLLRTATEFRSTQELARSIGYEPHPGVAASTYLAFTVEDSPGAPDDVPIPAGTRAQSNPDGDELPQTFETTEALLAHPEWNALRPRQTEPQLLIRDFCSQGQDHPCVLYFEGTDTRLNVGDWMLLRAPENADPDSPGVISNIPLQVVRVEPDPERQHTRVELVRPQASTFGSGGPLVSNLDVLTPPPSVFTEPFVLSATNVVALATEFTWSVDDIELFEQMHFLPYGTIAKYVNKAAVDPKPAAETGVFAMRVETAPFGHNAPRHDTLPRDWTGSAGPFPEPWDDDPLPINQTSRGADELYKGIYGDEDEENEIILLNAVFPEILPGSWVLLKGSGEDSGIASFRVTNSEQVSRADFALTAEVTALTLEANEEQIGDFHLRTTSIYAQSEPLPLAGKPIDTPIEGDTIELDHKLERRIYRGQPVVVSGTPTDVEEIIENELAIVKDAKDNRLVFEEKLQRAYRRDTVRLNANVVPATHGESQKEVLGGGDASQPFQTFQLSHAPLTYLSAPVLGGAESTLELRVNDVLWDEAANLFGLKRDDRRYLLRRDEAGKTSVTFGDGHTGKRLPTGFENLSASYRSGLGVAGNLLADKISLLASQPRYVQAVTNPLPATGGADPESSTDTGRNAPNSVRTFGRIVSLQDFEDFARAFAGISKAQASLLHLGEGVVVHVTIAGEEGALVPSDSDLYRDLVEAMGRARDPFPRLLVMSYERRFFDVGAKVRVHADYQGEIVLKAVEESLRETFSFKRRALAQSATLSEIMATMHRVCGVEAVDLDLLRLSHERNLKLPSMFLSKPLLHGKVESRLPALPARRDASGQVQPAQLLNVHGIQLSAML